MVSYIQLMAVVLAGIAVAIADALQIIKIIELHHVLNSLSREFK